MSETFERKYTRDDDETEIVVEISVSNWGCSAQTYGPPEKCYPAESMEVEIIKAWLDVSGMPPHPVTLTDAESERMALDFIENPPEDDEPDYDRDRDYDRD